MSLLIIATPLVSFVLVAAEVAANGSFDVCIYVGLFWMKMNLCCVWVCIYMQVGCSVCRIVWKNNQSDDYRVARTHRMP